MSVKYSYADELKGPSELGVYRDGSFSSVADSLAAVNYYVDAVGFGSSTGFAEMRGGQASGQQPLGVRYFLDTGFTCSNGQPMFEYVDTVPTGSLFGPRITRELENMELPLMKGLVPGMLEDAVGATNPVPYLRAAVGNVYPKCRQVEKRVGSNDPPYVRSRNDRKNVWMKPDRVDRNGIPYQRRWVLDRWITQKEWDCERRRVEGFQSGASESSTGNQLSQHQIAGAALLGLLGAGILAHSLLK